VFVKAAASEVEIERTYYMYSAKIQGKISEERDGAADP